DVGVQGAEHKPSVEELRTLVLETGYLAQKHQSILINLFDLQAVTVDDVMVPRNQIETIDVTAPLDEIAELLRARHLLNFVQQGTLTHEHLRTFVREPYFVPSGTALFSQLQNCQ